MLLIRAVFLCFEIGYSSNAISFLFYNFFIINPTKLHLYINYQLDALIIIYS